MDPLTDRSPMPFGQYGGDKEQRFMEEVPASYLLWLWDNGLSNFVMPRPPWKPIDEQRRAVRNYIIENASVLQQEADDVILKNPIPTR